MANLDYLKIGNFIKQETIGCYFGNIQASIIQIKQLEVNDKTAWVNGSQYKIVGDKLYGNVAFSSIALSEIDKKFETKIKNELNTELSKLEDTIHYLFGLADGAKCAENLIATEHMLRIIKEANKKIRL